MDSNDPVNQPGIDNPDQVAPQNEAEPSGTSEDPVPDGGVTRTTDQKELSPTGLRTDLVLAIGIAAPALPAVEAAAEAGGFVLEPVPTLGEGIARIDAVIPGHIVVGHEFGSFNFRSLCSVLRSDPEHRAIPIALVTEAEPRSLDVGLFGPDQILPLTDGLEHDLTDFLSRFQARKTFSDNKDRRRLVGRVLLTEDSLLAQRIVGRLLHVAGAQVTTVETLAEAIAALQRDEYDLILLDMEMSQMSCFDMPVLLRHQGIETPILTLVGHLIDEYAKDAQEYGVSGVIAKPVRAHELIHKCEPFLREVA